jgi:type I restriction enzyme M protein
VFDKEFFYFNKQAIMLTNVDENGKSFVTQLEEKKTSLKLNPTQLENGDSEALHRNRTLIEFTIADTDTRYDLLQVSSLKFNSLKEVFEQDIKPFIDSLNYKEQPLIITTNDARYKFDSDRETLVKEVNGKCEELGCGKIVVKAALKKATKKSPEQIEITVELTPDYQKDHEIIPFHRHEVENQKAIAAFMAKYITKPFEYLENVVGVDINFNKVFYKPETLRGVEEILGEIATLDDELKRLEEELSL